MSVIGHSFGGYTRGHEGNGINIVAVGCMKRRVARLRNDAPAQMGTVSRKGVAVTQIHVRLSRARRTRSSYYQTMREEQGVWRAGCMVPKKRGTHKDVCEVYATLP